MNGRRFTIIGFIAVGLMLTGPAWAAGRKPVSAASLVRPGDPIYGNPRGAVTIVDFYDIRCPPCRAMNKRIHHLIAADPSVRYVPVDYPILGPASVLGVEALFAARMQDKYKPLRARLMTQKRQPTMAILREDAMAIGLDWSRLELDMNGDQVAGMVQENLLRGRALAIHAIPAIFIGRTRVAGSLSYADLRSIVDEVQRTAAQATGAKKNHT